MVASLTCLMSASGGLIDTPQKASVWIVAPHKVGLPQKKYAEERQPEDR